MRRIARDRSERRGCRGRRAPQLAADRASPGGAGWRGDASGRRPGHRTAAPATCSSCRLSRTRSASGADCVLAPTRRGRCRARGRRGRPRRRWRALAPNAVQRDGQGVEVPGALERGALPQRFVLADHSRGSRRATPPSPRRAAAGSRSPATRPRAPRACRGSSGRTSSGQPGPLGDLRRASPGRHAAVRRSRARRHHPAGRRDDRPPARPPGAASIPGERSPSTSAPPPSS